jgi:hypothetical protein
VEFAQHLRTGGARQLGELASGIVVVLCRAPRVNQQRTLSFFRTLEQRDDPR